MNPKVLILRTAGTNCDRETEFAFNRAGARVYLYHINYVKKIKNLGDYQIICIPGGFSYGDDLGAGKILSLEIMLWLKEELVKFIEKGGLVLGICNGFQVLARSGILPDLDFQQKVTLTVNNSARFEDRWVYLKNEIRDTLREYSPREYSGQAGQARYEIRKIWLKDLPKIISLPVAHMEGKFYADRQVLDKIENNNQVMLRYSDEQGNLSGFPYNPNGSLNNIAGITDSSGKVFGLMPHPERFMFTHQRPGWQNNEYVPFGFKIFENAVNYFK